MRALFKKSEFCSDEHAEQYKVQVLDRLLTKSDGGDEPVAPLPLRSASESPLESLESRTPLLGAETIQGGPHRLAAPKPGSLPVARDPDFGSLLDRLPEKKSAPPPAGKIAGWDREGGEDPLEALLRLEKSAASSTPGFGSPPNLLRPPAPAPSTASSEDDAIAALRKLAEDARESARPKPPSLVGPEEDPFERLRGGAWESAGPPQGPQGWAGEQLPEIPADGGADESESSAPLFERPVGTEFDSEVVLESGGLSIFDRLAKSFDPGRSGAIEDAAFSEASEYPGQFREFPIHKAVDEGLEGVDADPFTGSVFERLMSDPAGPHRANPDELAPVIEAAAGPEQAAETGAKPSSVPTAEVVRDPAESRLASEQADASAVEEAPPKAPRPMPVEAEPVARKKGRTAPPIEPRFVLTDVVPDGWPGEAGMSRDGTVADRRFAEQRDSEAQRFSAPSPDVIGPSRLCPPAGMASLARLRGCATAIRWRCGDLPITFAVPALAETESGNGVVAAKISGAQHRAGLPLAANAILPRQTLSLRPTAGLRTAGDTIDLPIASPTAAAAGGLRLPPSGCLPADSPVADPPAPLTPARNGGGAAFAPLLRLAELLPIEGMGGAVPFGGHGDALAPYWHARFPGNGQNGSTPTSHRANIPAPLANLAGVEPAGCLMDTVDLDRTRRIVAEQAARSPAANGQPLSHWDNGSSPLEPLFPALGVGNGNRP